MRKLLCLLGFHRYRYVENMIPDVVDFRCECCGKLKIVRL